MRSKQSELDSKQFMNQFKFLLIAILLVLSIVNCNKKEPISILEIRDLIEKQNLVEELRKAEEDLRLKGDNAALLYVRGWIRYLQKTKTLP
ncbi:hypothetical protein LEP1GSC116_1095 [Leptospira interrogans serovar Icterohaemorrhagiae str. Verdun HP]|uniref:Uncharacterized protein n=1 Tax=Leptospira interrogans serovar Icterohaemorrhagiae str. Verdun HP TaxID=1049910 RepID=M6S0P3_LEPIR|nr:hypothetical protein LEP1GSC116_1095 [Leptospira interrogans serovar Icterohaemorrhagiae str. Verdun HP]KPA33034.1 Tetratricopeptide repeat protein [Leptospira interrogans]